MYSQNDVNEGLTTVPGCSSNVCEGMFGHLIDNDNITVC